jgi:putative SOS response-associated peptidase YedK
VNQTIRVANQTAQAPRVGEPGAVIRRDGDGLEMVNLHWGLRPAEEGGRPYATVRAEERVFPLHRCLLPASEFLVDEKRERWRFSLASGDHFYFAGVVAP